MKKPTHADEVLGILVGVVFLTIAAVIMATGILVYGTVAFFVVLARDTWRTVITCLVCAAIVTAPALTYAQEAEEAPRLERVERGDRAPFTGILAPEALFVDWRTRIVLLEERLRIEGEAATALLAVEHQLGIDRLHAESSRRELVTSLYEGRIEILAAELLEAREDAELGFFEQPAFWFAMGVLVTGAGVALVAVAVSGI